MRCELLGLLILASLLSSLVGNEVPLAAAEESQPLSHARSRSEHKPKTRELPAAGLQFVDVNRGDDAAAGSLASPWKTIAKALKQVQPGQTIVLRAGNYYEQVRITSKGTAEAPITLRAFPNELVILDGGFAEFFKQPKEAWEPVPNGAPQEYRSVRKFPGLERVVGNFGDSLLPLNAYREVADLRAENEAPLTPADDDEQLPLCYFGPGVWYDKESERIHIRLAHTYLPAFGDDNYQGVTDPRQIPLVIAPWKHAPLTLQDAAHIVVQDLVLRGGGDNILLIRGCQHISLEGLTLYVANRGLRVETTGHLQVTNSLFRGTMPPWGSRTVSKYRTTDSHLFVPVGTERIERELRVYFEPQCHDFEISHCEFTDSHDGVYVGGVQRLKFHHNLVDNMNDDGVYLSAWGPPGSDVHIYQNHLSRCLTTFAFGLGRGQESDPGTGTYIYRNVIDLRKPVLYRHPLPEEKEITSYGRLCGDHASPVWEPLKFYHNTVFTHEGAFREAYAAGWGGSTRGTQRYVFNNIFVQELRLPGLVIQLAKPDILQADGNLHWSYDVAATQSSDFPTRLKALAKQNENEWGKRDLLADPHFQSSPDNSETNQAFRLSADSPAINAGVTIPEALPDPLRTIDQGQPDVGAYPVEYEQAEAGRRE
jgi:hypothetical protein